MKDRGRVAVFQLAYKLIIIAVISIPSLTGLPPARAEQLAAPSAAWTFMVYMDGDNNLEAYGIADFMEMSRVGSTSQVNIIVQFDRIGGYSTAYGNWTDARRFRITPGMTPDAHNGTSIGEVNMGHPQTLINFVQWAKSTYPAQRYALILWDHGSGWRVPIAGVPVQRGIAYDDSSGGNGLNAPELRSAYHAITSGGSEPLDVVGFDACLMGMIEVDGQLIPYARVRVGSQETEPGAGWPYEPIMRDLTANPAMSGAQLGTTIVNHYADYYGGETQSAVDLGSSYTALNTAVDRFAGVLISVGGSYKTAISSARSNTQAFDNPNFVDLYDFAYEVNQRVSDSNVRAAATQVMSAVNGAVIAERHGSYWAGAHGISIYFPASKSQYDQTYDGSTGWLQFTQNTQWDEWLHQYYTSSSLPAPALLEPKNGMLTADATPTFRWEAVPGAVRYRIQVDNDANFSSPVINTTRTQTHLTPATALGSKPYYWRVQVKDAGGSWSVWSTAGMLTIDRIKPVKSKLATPGNGATVSSVLPIFEWTNDSPDVAYYQIQIDNVSAFTSPEYNVSVSGTRFIPAAALNDRAHFWRVRAYDRAGNRGPWSVVWKVRIASTNVLIPLSPEPITPTTVLTLEPTIPVTPVPTDTPVVIVEPTIAPTATLVPTEPPPAWQTIESDTVGVRQDGLWTMHETALASGGRYIYSSGALADVLTLRFSGTYLELLYVRHPALGMLAVEIDGVLVQVIDSRADDAEFGARAAFTLAAGVHTARVYALSGTVAIDAFAVESALEPLPEPTIPPTAEPTIAPTQDVVTAVPTETPVPVIPPTSEPTVTPEPTATLEPTITPTSEPTATPTVESSLAAPDDPPVETPAS